MRLTIKTKVFCFYGNVLFSKQEGLNQIAVGNVFWSKQSDKFGTKNREVTLLKKINVVGGQPR